jgi:hypothetical protein
VKVAQVRKADVGTGEMTFPGQDALHAGVKEKTKQIRMDNRFVKAPCHVINMISKIGIFRDIE